MGGWFTAVSASISGCLALLLGACTSSVATLEVPVANWPGYEYVYLAHRLGIDRQEGIVIKPLQFPDPQTIVHAYLRGDLKIAQLTTVEAVDLCARLPDRCPVIVLVLDESRGGDQIALINALSSLQQLQGQSVAVTYSTLGPYVLSRALELRGMSLQDVHVRNIPLAQMPAALRSGEVQAAVFFPPFSDYASRDSLSRVVFDSRSIPGELFDVLVVDPAYLNTHADQITALIRAWSRTHQEAKRDPERVLALAAKREQLSLQEFREAEQGLVYFDLDRQQILLADQGVLTRNLRAVQKVQQRLKLLPPEAPLPPVAPRYAGDAQ